MEAALTETGGPWILGEMYSLAEMCVAPLIDRMEDLGYEGLWEDNHPRVTQWFAALKARPSYSIAFYEGARFSDIYPDLKLGRSPPAA